MKKLKHNKIKNTGLLFEILTRIVIHEAMDQTQKQNAIQIIKKHFKVNSELLKELRLYQTLLNRNENDPNELLNLTLESFNSLNKKVLLNEKFNLIKSIKNLYNEKVFFDTRNPNYKSLASIYKLFEYSGKDNPDEYLSNKRQIIENLSGKNEEVINESISLITEQDPDIRKLAFKIIIEKFNTKYKELNSRQKKLLSNYINSDINKDDFKNYVLKEVSYIFNSLTKLSKKVKDEVRKIKLNETINLTQNILTAKSVKEEHLTSMLKYYELIEVLENE